jgi:hypothetical protein
MRLFEPLAAPRAGLHSNRITFASYELETCVAQPNYRQQKKQRETAKKKKNDEKRERRARTQGADQAAAEPGAPPSEKTG